MSCVWKERNKKEEVMIFSFLYLYIFIQSYPKWTVKQYLVTPRTLVNGYVLYSITKSTIRVCLRMFPTVQLQHPKRETRLCHGTT